MANFARRFTSSQLGLEAGAGVGEIWRSPGGGGGSASGRRRGARLRRRPGGEGGAGGEEEAEWGAGHERAVGRASANVVRLAEDGAVALHLDVDAAGFLELGVDLQRLLRAVQVVA